jgi:hypothetical protein
MLYPRKEKVSRKDKEEEVQVEKNVEAELVRVKKSRYELFLSLSFIFDYCSRYNTALGEM